MDGRFRDSIENFLGPLRRLCDTAFGSSGAIMLATIEDARTRVVIFVSDGAEGGLSPGASAEFSFTRDQLTTLRELGVSESTLATSAFRDLLDRLAGSSSDRVGFVQVVNKRLGAASSGRQVPA